MTFVTDKWPEQIYENSNFPLGLVKEWQKSAVHTLLSESISFEFRMYRDKKPEGAFACPAKFPNGLRSFSTKKLTCLPYLIVSKYILLGNGLTQKKALFKAEQWL